MTLAVVWNPWGAWLTLAAAVFWIMAGLVLFTRPDRWQNRYLALGLGVEPFLLIWGGGPGQLQDSMRVVHALGLVTDVAIPFFAVAYIGFLGTVGVPGLGWTHARAGPFLLGLLALGLTGLYLGQGGTVDSVIPGTGTALTWAFTTSAAGRMQWILFIAFFTLALLGTFAAWRRSPPGSLVRGERRLVFAAFAVRDAGLALILASFFIGVLPLSFRLLLVPVPSLLSVGLLTYGILRHRLFDIDIKLKWTLNRSTLVGIFLAIFFVVTVVAENFLTERYGWAIGGVGAGLLLFALAPLQRFADRVADAAMPGVKPVRDMSDDERSRLYRSLLAAAYEDGAVDPTERHMLERLRTRLGIDAEVAMALETSLRTGGARV